MSLIRKFVLVHQQARNNAAAFCHEAPEGSVVDFKEPTRTLSMNAKFHAICGDLEKSGLKWAGSERKLEEWKILLISGLAIATNTQTEVVRGLEGELVNLRESSATMSKRRGSELIEYAIAFCAMNNVKIQYG